MQVLAVMLFPVHDCSRLSPAWVDNNLARSPLGLGCVSACMSERVMVRDSGGLII